MNNLYISIENWYFLGAFKVPFVIRLYFIILHIPIKTLIKRTISWLETLRLELDLASIEPRIEMKVWKQKIDLKAAQNLKNWFWKVKIMNSFWGASITLKDIGHWLPLFFKHNVTAVDSSDTSSAFIRFRRWIHFLIMKYLEISSSKRFTCNIRNWNASGMNFDRGMDQRIFLHKGIIPSSTESINIK